MEPRRDEIDLAAELRMLRPAPRQEFAAGLDARAAAGFPADPERGSTPAARFLSRLWTMPPRRLLLPAGGFAAAAIVVATAVVAISTNSGESRQVATVDSATAPTKITPLSEQLPPGVSKEHSAAEPLTLSAASLQSLDRSLFFTSKPYAVRANHRDIARDAQITLGADPSEVREVSAKVFETVHSYDGIVLSSSIADGSGGDAGAHFELLIPSAKLSDAMASLSGLAEVHSRHESSQDITAPTVSLGEHLQDSQAKIESLLGQLAEASSDSERAAIEVELRAERAHAATLRSRLSSLQRRANLSQVSLRIETGATSSGSGGSWGVDDALGDAGHILAVAAGVTLIGLAIVGPLALIALLVWLARRILVKRSRERALA